MWRWLLTRFERLGLQRRIMLYVTAGLVVFSVILGFVALQAVQQSADLVLRERLLMHVPKRKKLTKNSNTPKASWMTQAAVRLRHWRPIISRTRKRFSTRSTLIGMPFTASQIRAASR